MKSDISVDSGEQKPKKSKEISNQNDSIIFIDEDGRQYKFETPEIRKKFVQRVFTLVTCMIIVCSFIGAIPILSPPVRHFFHSNIFIFISIQLLWIVAYITIGCIRVLRQQFPWNWISLSIFTGLSGLLVAVYISYFDFVSIIIAFILTLMASVSLILYATFTKTDFTTCGALVCCLSLMLLGFAIILIITQCIAEFYIPWLHQLYCLLGALLTMFMLVIDVQQIMGKNRIKIATNEYCFAAITLFTDIFQMFMFILGAVGGGGNRNN